MDEIWKDIPGLEGKYQVSSLGRVKSLEHQVPHSHMFNTDVYTVKGKVLNPDTDSYGGVRVSLPIDGKRKMVYVKKVVVETFMNIKVNGRKQIICHKDGNTYNCALDNLYVKSRGQRWNELQNEGVFGKKYDYYGEELTIYQIRKLNNDKVPRIRMNERIKRYQWNIYEAAEIPVGKCWKEGRKWAF